MRVEGELSAVTYNSVVLSPITQLLPDVHHTVLDQGTLVPGTSDTDRTVTSLIVITWQIVYENFAVLNCRK